MNEETPKNDKPQNVNSDNESVIILQRRYYKFAMAGVIFSGLVLLLAVGTFYCQQQFNASILSPDVDVQLLRIPNPKSELGEILILSDRSTHTYQLYFYVTNTGQKTIHDLKWGAEADTVLLKKFSQNETRLAPDRQLAIAPGTADTLGSPVTIPLKSFKTGQFYLHVWLKYKSASKKQYIFHKAYDFDISKVIAWNSDSTDCWINEGKMYFTTELSERIP